MNVQWVVFYVASGIQSFCFWKATGHGLRGNDIKGGTKRLIEEFNTEGWIQGKVAIKIYLKRLGKQGYNGTSNTNEVMKELGKWWKGWTEYRTNNKDIDKIKRKISLRMSQKEVWKLNGNGRSKKNGLICKKIFEETCNECK